jgi:fructosamine-3-kinase
MEGLFSPPAVREAKPAFDMLPEAMRRKIESRLSGEIVSGETIYGSLSSSAGFVLTLDSGLKVFVKGSHPADTSHGTRHIRQEIHAYEYIPVLKDVSPRLYSWVSDNDEDGWTLGLWQHVEHAADNAAISYEEILRLVARVHAAEIPAGVIPAAQEHNYIGAFLTPDRKWRRLGADSGIREKFLGLFEEPAEAGAWFSRNEPQLSALQGEAADSAFHEGLIHGDLRMDNVLLGRQRAFLVDWPNACRGPLAFDLVMLCSHLESCGAGTAEDFLSLYDGLAGTAFSAHGYGELCKMAAAMSGYFADQAYRDVPERLPRLRWMQKSLLCAQLQFLARCGRIESPPRFTGQRII